MEEDNYDMIFKLIIVGDSGVGKTGIIERYISGVFNDHTKSTVGVEFGTKKIEIGGKKLKAQIWDTAGQERYRSITNAYYKGAKGALIVYDITNINTFESVERWLREIKVMGDKNMFVILIGNKSDLNEERKVLKDQGINKASTNNIGFFETSAKTSDNIDRVFYDLSNNIFEKHKSEICNEFDDLFENKLLENRSKAITITINDSNKKREDSIRIKKKCCK